MDPLNGRTASAYLRTADAAKLLSLSEGTLANWRVRGDGPPFVKLGARIAYSPEQVIAWAESRRCRSTSEAQRADGGAA